MKSVTTNKCIQLVRQVECYVNIHSPVVETEAKTPDT